MASLFPIFLKLHRKPVLIVGGGPVAAQKLDVLAQCEARVVVVAAGMEGALASVVGGLVAAPVVAVPTSVGYGASFGGIAPLLTMLNSCAPGVAVVHIDNGFGAGYMAAMINRMTASKPKQ